MARLGSRGLTEPIRAWLAAERPFLGICLGLQLLFDGSDEDGATTLGVVPGRTVRLEDAPTLPHIGWNQVERTRPHPLFDGIADGADFYFVHSYAGVPETRRRAGRSRPRHDRARHAGSSRRSRAGRCSASSSTRNGAARTAFACWPTSSTSCEPPDAPPPRHPLSRRRRRRVVKGTRFVDLVDEGDPAELAERYADRGRRRAGLPRHQRGARTARHAPRHRRADGPAGVHPADGRRRRAHASPRCATSSAPAPTRSRSTPRRSPTRR